MPLMPMPPMPTKCMRWILANIQLSELSLRLSYSQPWPLMIDVLPYGSIPATLAASCNFACGIWMRNSRAGSLIAERVDPQQRGNVSASQTPSSFVLQARPRLRLFQSFSIALAGDHRPRAERERIPPASLPP